MAVKSKVKNIFLVILLVLVSFVLSAINFFSGQGGGKTNQAQAQCWTTPPPLRGSCGGCGLVSCGFGCGCGCGCGSCGCGCGCL